jgi:hypothetical protein
VQQLFQCRCPPQSEQIRYRPFVVLASACRNPEITDLSTDARWLLYREGVWQGQTLLMNLETRRTQALNIDPNAPASAQFIRSTLLLVTRRDNTFTRSFSLYDITGLLQISEDCSVMR